MLWKNRTTFINTCMFKNELIKVLEKLLWSNCCDNSIYNDHDCSKLYLTLKGICCYKEMLTSVRFPHHNQLVKENIIQMNLNAIISKVYISSILYGIKIHKDSLLYNVTDNCPCKRPRPDHQID